MHAPQPLSPRATPQPVARLNRKVIIPVITIGVVLTAYLVTRGMDEARPKLKESTPPPTEGRQAAMPEFLRRPVTITPIAHAEASTPAESPPAPPAQPVAPAAPVKVARTIPPPPTLPKPPVTPQPPASQYPTTTAPQSVVARKEPDRWLFPKEKSAIAQPPFPVPAAAPARQATNLIAQAQWAQCADRTRCLYETQLIHGQIVQAINSDIPGAVWIKVTNEVTDMFGQGVTLVPQGTTLVGAQQGTPKVGQERLDFLVQRGILPDGTVLSFQGSRLGDATGATGLEGHVNNHYVKLGIATVLTAALSVGARVAGGTSDGFRSTPEEEFGRDIAGSINNSGRDIIRRQLVQGPTITLKEGTAVVVQLKETVSLQTPPVIVRQ